MYPIPAVSDSQEITWNSEDMDELDGFNREIRTCCPNLEYMIKYRISLNSAIYVGS